MTEDGRYEELYFKEGHQIDCRETYYYHMENLRRVVPEGKLYIVEVKDGWDPLCKILGKEVPQEPFLGINDANATEDFFLEVDYEGRDCLGTRSSLCLSRKLLWNCISGCTGEFWDKLSMLPCWE